MTKAATYSRIISPGEYNRLMSCQHIYIRKADDVIERLVRYYANHQSSEVVELGCGPGRITPILATKNSDLSFTGVDHDDEFLAYARQTILGSGLRNLQYVRADVRDYCHGKPVDIFVSQGMHHHIPMDGSKQAYLQNAYSQLKPGGIYILSDEILPQYATDEERLIKAITWYSRVINCALNKGYTRLAIEEAKTLLDDLASSKADTPPKTEARVSRVLEYVPAIDEAAIWGDWDRARKLAETLLSKLLRWGGAFSPADASPAMSLSRGDHKVCQSHLIVEVEQAGFKNVGVETVGMVTTIGGMGVYIFQK